MGTAILILVLSTLPHSARFPYFLNNGNNPRIPFRNWLCVNFPYSQNNGNGDKRERVK